MTESTECEMVRKLDEDPRPRESFTSLQPTYEDSVPTADELGYDDGWDERS